MNYLLTEIFLGRLTVAAISLVVAKRIEFRHFTVLPAFALVSSVVIANLDVVKRLKLKDFEMDLFERQVAGVKEKALREIEAKVDAQKMAINDLTSGLTQQQNALREAKVDAEKALTALRGPVAILKNLPAAGYWVAQSSMRIAEKGDDHRVNYAERIYDTNNAVAAGTTWTYTAAVAGLYQVRASLAYRDGKAGWGTL